MKKETFCNIMRELQAYNMALDELADIGVIFEDNAITRIVDHTLDILIQDIEDKEDWICYYAWELDWGTADYASTCVVIDDEIKSLTTPEELYDLIMELKNNE
jgi:hypothetical protein